MWQWPLQVVGALLRGNHLASLLAESAAEEVLAALASHIPEPQAADEAKEHNSADLPALHALDAAIFSQAVLLRDDRTTLRPAAIEALVAMFELAWQSEGPELVDTAVSDPGEGEPAHYDRTA
jgi:hypothetical protein